VPTPGSTTAQEASDHFSQANDHATSAQGNLVGGNGPVWHGGGSGYNQLIFDDTDNQGRVQLRTPLAATELNLGHLVHNTSNYRGSLRRLGANCALLMAPCAPVRVC